VSQLPFTAPINFTPAPDITEPHPAPALWIIMRDREVLVASPDSHALPATAPALEFSAVQFLGSLRDAPIMTAAVAHDTEAPSGWSWVALRSLYGVLEDDLFSLCGRAAQLLDWELCHAFCGRCGTRTQRDGKERCMRCNQCGLNVFPRIEPAVIVAVTRAPNQILLAHAGRLPAGMHSVLAGFVEPGESLEQCVEREVFEETGIRVGNVRYVASQPWPFPRGLMVGFIADYVSGSIVIDPHELQGAAWFALDDLPPVPSRLSIARYLIEYAKAQAMRV
jgi:NAD+ diphosphatase